MTLDIVLKLLLKKPERILLKHQQYFAVGDRCASQSEDTDSENELDQIHDNFRGKYSS